MNIIKFLKCKMLFVAAMLFAFVFAYADDTLNIPQKINIQGRLTTDYGDPITVQKTITIISDNGSRYNLSVTPDSEGLYSADVPISGLGFVVDNYPQKFKIEVDRVPSNDYAFSSAPYSIYSSTSVYSIIAGTATFAESLYTKFELSNDNFSSSTTYSNIKLADENFKTGALYTVTVTTSQLAVAANKINSSSTTGMVWGMIEGDNQGWVKVSSIPVDYAATAGTATVAISVLTGTQSLSTGYNVLISSKNNNDYTQIWVSTANLTVGTAAFATKASQDAKGNDIEETYEIKFNTEHQLSTECISGLADVAISGSYNSLSDTPIIPAAQIQSDWEQTDDTQLDYIKNKPTIPDYKGGEGIEISSDNTIKVLVDGTNIIINDDGKIDLGSGADLAEIYASSERLQPGDVVSIDTTRNDAVVKTKTAEDTKVAGVVSTEPGLLLNKNQKGYKLALVGKVPTKVCNEGGAIKRGDLLVSASVAGYAKKAGANPKPGTIIGKALENFSSNKKGTILVLVNLQ